MPEVARAHLAGCRSCQGLVEDLTAIVATAHLLPAEVEPPPRVWVSLRTQLEEEGIIRNAVARGVWWQHFPDLFRTRVLATAGVGLLVVAGGPPAGVASNGAAIPTHNYDDTAMALKADVASMQLAGSSLKPVDMALHQNLDIVDKFIVDCEQRVKEQPEDELARDYLSGAYQQKAQLLSIMMEREGGVY